MERPTFSLVTERLLAEGLRVRFYARGRSMLPTVRDGECVTVEPLAAQKVALGDVVLCETWRGPVAHRVLAIDVGDGGARRFTLRGDASDELDRPIDARQLRGRVATVEREGRARSLAIGGGLLGRVVVVAALRLRPGLVAAARRLAAPLRPATDAR
jgi:hypothetical protein